MTEAGKKWANSHDKLWQKVDPTIYGEAEFWIRAFVHEVEKRTDELRKECSNPREAAFVLLKRELLGGSDGAQ